MKLKKLKWFLYGVWIGFTPSVFSYADMSRGYDATGGEIFYPFIPLIGWLIVECIKDSYRLSSK